MRVRMIVSISGTRDGVDWPPAGGVIEVPEHEAVALVLGRLAEPLGDVESADLPAGDVETAAVDSRPRRR